MKNNISYYPHKTNSHNEWRFKTLRRQYGWAGEGRFYALQNIIAESEGCRFYMHDEEEINSAAADLDFSPEELFCFIEFLAKKCKLLVIEGGVITTEDTQETLGIVMKRRSYDRERKIENSTTENHFSTTENRKSKKNTLANFSTTENQKSTVENSNYTTENSNSTVENQQSKVKESKVKKTTTSMQPQQPDEGNIYGNLERFKDDAAADMFFISTIATKGVEPILIPGWLDAFNRRLIFTKDTLKSERDYRSHFGNWIVKVPNYRKLNPQDYDPVKDAPQQMELAQTVVMEVVMTGAEDKWTLAEYQRYCNNNGSGYKFLRYE